MNNGLHTKRHFSSPNNNPRLHRIHIIYWYEWFQNNADYASDLLPVVWEELTSEQQEIYVEETTTEINNILEEIRWSQAAAKAMDVLIENVKQEEGAKNGNTD